MSRNGSGVYTKVNTFVSGNSITAAGHNANWDDLATEMTNSVAADGQTSMTGPLKAASGTVSAPGITFASDPDSGIYRAASNSIGVSAGGSQVGLFDNGGLGVTGSVNATTIKQAGFTLIPVGLGPLPWSRTSAPDGWVLANGEPLLRASYPALWAVAEAEIALGNTLYTNGNGTTTFTVADVCGRIPAGADNIGGITRKNRLTSTAITPDATTYGATGGAQTRTLAANQIPAGVPSSGSNSISVLSAFADMVRGTVANFTATSGSAQFSAGNGHGALIAGSLTSTGSNSISVTSTNAGQAAVITVQPTIVTNYIIFAGA